MADQTRVRRPRAAPVFTVTAPVFLPSCGAGGTTFTFRIENRDTLALDSAYIDAGGPRWTVGNVPAGRDTACVVVLKENSLLHLTAIRAKGSFRVILGGYAAMGRGGRVDVVIAPGGRVDVGAPAPR